MKGCSSAAINLLRGIEKFAGREGEGESGLQLFNLIELNSRIFLFNSAAGR